MYRFTVFRENLMFVLEHNLSGDSFTLGMNRFGAITNAEYREIYTIEYTESNHKEYAEIKNI